MNGEEFGNVNVEEIDWSKCSKTLTLETEGITVFQMFPPSANLVRGNRDCGPG